MKRLSKLYSLAKPNPIKLVNKDPMTIAPLTFNIGTGSIEKVSRIRDKYNLIESYTSDYEPTGYTGR